VPELESPLLEPDVVAGATVVATATVVGTTTVAPVVLVP
jgi:hypothetical protein